MTASELNLFVGRTALFTTDGMHFPVKTVNAKKAWNRTDVLIQPIGGGGERWVSLDRITFNDDDLVKRA